MNDPIIAEAIAKKNPSIFTNYYMRNPAGGVSVMPGSKRYLQYMPAWEAAGKPAAFSVSWAEVPFEVEPRVDPISKQTYFFEKRGFLLLPWALEMYRAKQKHKYVLGLQGAGKTQNCAALILYLCATISNFKALNVAPLQYQSKQMFEAVKSIVQDTPFLKKFVKFHGKKWYREQPVLIIDFLNGSTFEFLNVDKGADNIQSWSGDLINVDEAGQLNGIDEFGIEELAKMRPNLVSRLRGTRPDGTPRMGWLSMISFGYDCDTFWDLYEASQSPNDQTWGRLVLHRDNPYLTQEQVELIRASVLPGEEDRYMSGIRPTPKGAEINGRLIDAMFKGSLLSDTQQKIDAGSLEHRISTGPGGIQLYETPPDPDRMYMVAGDPGTGAAPDRNAPTVIVWDVTDFPEQPARIVAFWWADGGGSYIPFVQKFGEYVLKYEIPARYRGYDSTASQKAIAELSWQQEGMEVMPMGFDGAKKWMYLNALKLILGKGLMESPEIHGIRQQLSRYHLPDKKIAQDIVAVFCMGAYMLFPLYREKYPAWEKDFSTKSGKETTDLGRDSRRSYGRSSRAR
jgi:hypothetical protein